MIEVTIRLNESGVISGITAVGHSGAAAKGHDIVCASASVLFRTLGRSLEGKEGMVVEGSADSRGEFFLEVVSCPRTLHGWLEGITSYILTGLKDLEAENPDELSVSIKV